MTLAARIARAGASALLVFTSALLAPPLLAQDSAPAKPKGAAVASANAYATDAGLEVLKAGGNAFDAAIAVSATLGLVEPESSGLGGGGFFLLHIAGGRRGDGKAEVFVDARERAPLAASRDMYLDQRGEPRPKLTVDGPLAAAIPGLPAGLVHLAKQYGRLPLKQSLAPAMRLAREGWKFGAKNNAMLGFRASVVAQFPVTAGMFLSDGKPLAIGTRLRNPDYAASLELLAEKGADGFYQGAFAKRLVDGVRAAGGIWTLEDLAQYRVVEREPLRVSHKDWRIVTVPPPSSGGVALAEMLNVLEGYDYGALDRIARVHLLVETMRRAYRDRAIYLGDPDFVQVPVDLLTNDSYAAGLRASINPERATPSEMLPGISAQPARRDTSHFSIVDAEGNLVGATQTVNLPYGNAFSVKGTGFVLNNEMDDFSVKPGVPNAFGLVGEDANAIAPGKRPLSSMSPTFLFGPDRIAVLGTPGGSRIVSMVFLGILALFEGQPAQAVVDLPRFHHQYLPDVIEFEAGTFSAEEQAQLAARGFILKQGERPWGNMQVVTWDLRTGALDAGSDSRWKGVGKGASDGSVFR